MPAPVKIPVDFYPMAALVQRGIILGIESDLVQRRDIGFAYFKISTRVIPSRSANSVESRLYLYSSRHIYSLHNFYDTFWLATSLVLL
jgi:hypothetical protein